MSLFNKEMVASVYAAMARHDFAAIQKLNHPQITVQQTELLPWGGTYQGLEGARQFMGRVTQYVDSTVEIDQVYEADGERVIVIGRTYGKVRRSGTKFSARLVHLWTLEEGLVTRLEPYLDTQAMLAILAHSGTSR